MAISTQIQNLNLIPGKSAPVVVHLSQGNVGNTVQFYLYDGDNPYYPTNVSIAVHGVRANNTVFGPYAVSVTSGSNLVSFDIVSAMTSVNGAAIGELVLTDSNQNQIGSANFGMLVEATPYSSSVTYEDDLSIYQRILSYVQSIPAGLQSQITAEVSARSSAVTDLQSQITAEVSARSSAVTDLQSQITAEATARNNAVSNEASTRSSADANLQSQINQIVAPSGEAPSAAEIQNARIGADGVTYSTLGEAIRTQNSDLMGALSIISASKQHEEVAENVVTNANRYYMFDGVAMNGQTIELDASMTNNGSFVTYAVLSKDQSSRKVIVNQATSYSSTYDIADGETVYGLMVWIKTSNNSSLSIKYNIKNRYEKLIESAQRTSVDISDTIEGVTAGQNYDYFFDQPLKNGQQLRIRASIGIGSQFNIYKILKKNNASSRELVAAYEHSYDGYIVSTNEKPIWGVRIYAQQIQTSNTLSVNLNALSIDDTADDYFETKKALYEDISYETANTIVSDTDNYYHYFPYKLFPGQVLHYNYKISDGAFYLYKLFDKNDASKREVISSAVSVTNASGIIVGNDTESFVGFMVWISNKVVGSVLTANYYAECNKSEDLIVPRAEIEPVLANLKWDKTAFNESFEFSPFVSIHFSDMHGDINALKRVSAFSQKYREYIDDVIHTGDAVETCYENDYPSNWYSPLKILQVIGNHDAWTNGVSGCKSWTTGYSAKQCYERYISPISSAISPVNNKCYWYKLYDASKIMLIAIDNFHWKETIQDQNGNQLDVYPDGESLDTGEQLAWFISTLDQARQGGYGVIVLSHLPAGAITKPCSFTSLLNNSMGGIPLEAVLAVQDFIDNGGEFVTWLCGHTHWDYIGELTNYSDQTIVVIDSARAKDRYQQINWQETHRIEGTRSENLFNVFSVDRNKKYLSLYRIGMEYDKFGRHIGSLVYDYENKEVIWNS